MAKNLGVQNIVIIGITCAIMVLLFALVVVQLQTEKVGKTKINSLVLIDKQYSESTGILTINLQNLGDSLDSMTKEDIEWYLNGQNMGTAYSISFTHEGSAKVESGEIIQIGLKTGKISPNSRIKLTFRGGFQIVLSM